MNLINMISACKTGLKELVSVLPDINIGDINIGNRTEVNHKVEMLHQQFSELSDEEIADKLVDSYMNENYVKKPVYMNGVFLYTDSERSFSDIEIVEIKGIISESEYEGNEGSRFVEKYLEEVEDICSIGNAVVINFSVYEYRHKYNEEEIIDFIDWLNRELSDDIQFTKYTIF